MYQNGNQNEVFKTRLECLCLPMFISAVRLLSDVREESQV